MKRALLTVRELTKTDIPLLINYWLDADNTFLTGMGVELAKMPTQEEWEKMLTEQLAQSYNEKKSYCIIWLLNDEPVGHCNVNKIIFGEEAFLHLHMWNANDRQKGSGAAFVKMALPYFFTNLEVKKIYCEPYTLNPSPNKTLEKIGFTFVKKYITIPGWLNFEQPVNLWELSYADYKKL